MSLNERIDAASEEHDVDPESLVPLPRLAFQILLALAERERHGYALLDAIERQTGGETRLGTSTLYASLVRLQKLGAITDAPPPAEADSDDERRRYYRITPFGMAVVREEALRIRQLNKILTDARVLDPSSPRSN